MTASLEGRRDEEEEVRGRSGSDERQSSRLRAESAYLVVQDGVGKEAEKLVRFLADITIVWVREREGS